MMSLEEGRRNRTRWMERRRLVCFLMAAAWTLEIAGGDSFHRHYSTNRHMTRYRVERENVWRENGDVEEILNVFVDGSCKVNCSDTVSKRNDTKSFEMTAVTNTGFSYLVFSVQDSQEKNATEICGGTVDAAISTCEAGTDTLTNLSMPDARCVNESSDFVVLAQVCVPTASYAATISSGGYASLLTSRMLMNEVSDECEIPDNVVPVEIVPNCSNAAKRVWPKTLQFNDTGCLIERVDMDCKDVTGGTSWCDETLGICKLCNEPFTAGCALQKCKGGTCTECDETYFQQRRNDVSSGELLGCFKSCPPPLLTDMTNNTAARPGLWCLSDCPFGSYNSTADASCRSCDVLCNDCVGPGPDHCTSCTHVVSSDGSCATDCLSYEYVQDGVCIKVSELLVFSTHLYIVGSVSCVVCAVMFYLYIRNKWRLQRHPGPLVMNKMMYDVVLCVVLMAQSISDSIPGEGDLCRGVISRRFSAWILMFSLCGAELSYLALCYDLHANLINPFREVRSATRFIRMLIFVVSLGAGLFVMTLSESGMLTVTKLSNFGELCWIDTNDQIAYAFLVYIPIGFIYSLGVYFTAKASCTLRDALPKAQQVWSAVFRQQSLFILGFSMYWICIGVMLALQSFLADKYGNSTRVYVAFSLNFFLGSRGALTVLIWFKSVYRDDKLQHTNIARSQSLARAIARSLSFDHENTSSTRLHGAVSPRRGLSSVSSTDFAEAGLPFVSAGGTTTSDDEDGMDFNLQPHLNVALRQELLYFTRVGILHSLKKFRKHRVDENNNPSPRRRRSVSSSRFYCEKDEPITFTFDGMEASSTTRLLQRDVSSPGHSSSTSWFAGVANWRKTTTQESGGQESESRRTIRERKKRHRPHDHVDVGEEDGDDDDDDDDFHSSSSSSSSSSSPDSLNASSTLCCCLRRRGRQRPKPTFPITFTDFFRHTFDEIRSLLNISQRRYMRSMKSISGEHFSKGKSGSFFFFSGDKRYMVKSISREEFTCLRQILPAMKKYFLSDAGRHSLLAKFLGCHSITIYTQQIYFVVMTNSLYAGSGRNALKIHERYDLKGAWVGRNAPPLAPGTRAKCIHCNLPFLVGETVATVGSDAQCPERPVGRNHEPYRLFLDNDMTRKVTLETGLAVRIKKQLSCDTEFLRSQGLIDYSMLLGVHTRRFDIFQGTSNLAMEKIDEGRPTPSSSPHGKLSSAETKSDSVSTSMAQTPMRGFLLGVNGNRDRQHCKFENQILRAAYVEGPALYFISIVDVLQQYTFRKRMERLLKIALRCRSSDGFCVIPPDAYADRFRNRIIEGAIEGVRFTGHGTRRRDKKRRKRKEHDTSNPSTLTSHQTHPPTNRPSSPPKTPTLTSSSNMCSPPRSVLSPVIRPQHTPSRQH